MSLRNPVIDQLVFGYRDGHELLAASMSLSSGTEREILPHVDASFDDESPHYLVGLPLTTLDRYLLARIWPAPELERPGAVWAHALLSDRHAMDTNTARLLGMLERPSLAALDRFRAPARLVGEVEPRPVPERLATGLAWAVLGAPEDRPVVLWSALPEAEQAIVDFVGALPAAARWTFSFRTRGRARMGDAHYELQVASRLVGRSPGPHSKILDLRRPGELDAPVWAQLAMQSAGGRDLRGFLAEFGDEFVTKRRQVRSLVDVWAALAAPDPRGSTSELLGAFREPDAVSKLKIAMYGDAGTQAALWRIPEADRLEIVFNSPHSFDWEALGVSARLSKLLESEPARATDLAALLVTRVSSDRSAERVLDEFSGAVKPSAIEFLAPHEELFTFVLERKPQLLEDARAWTDIPVSMAGSTLSHCRGPAHLKAALRAALKAGRDDIWIAIAREDLADMDAVVATAVGDATPEVRLKQIEDANSAGLAGWLAEGEIRVQDSITLARSLSVKLLARRPPALWLDAAARLHSSFESSDTHASAKLLTIALNAEGVAADQLLRETFAPVHRALVERRLSQEVQASLDKSLPGTAKEGRPRRLRSALVKRARAGDWRESEIAHALAGAGEDGERLVKLVPKKDPLRRLLEAAVERAAHILR